ncbi:MAG: hypothetical protein RIR65_1189, partial [Planctomycetota bacterium]
MQAMQTSDRLKLGSLVHAAPRAHSGAVPSGARAWFALATVATLSVSAIVPSCGGIFSSSPPSVPSPSIE